MLEARDARPLERNRRPPRFTAGAAGLDHLNRIVRAAFGLGPHRSMKEALVVRASTDIRQKVGDADRCLRDFELDFETTQLRFNHDVRERCGLK